jgi:hypothetical protein
MEYLRRNSGKTTEFPTREIVCFWEKIKKERKEK